MADSVRASRQGLEIVDQARYRKGWRKQVTVQWWEIAHTSQATLKRFWQRKPIERQAFIAICRAVGIDWEEVVEYNKIQDPQSRKATRVPHNSKSELLIPELYIERPPLESCCYETLLQPGSLIRIKALRQMGKTMLLDRVLAQVAQLGYRIAFLSFKLAERNHFTDLDKFLRWFCTMIARELQIPSQLDDYWEEDIAGSKADCTTYFEEYLLPATNSPLVIALDDLDLIFPYAEIYEDFFALLRFWHERAKSRQLWKKLKLVVVYSTEVYIPLNINQSPFNVGVPIELLEFNQEEVQKFAQLYELDWDMAQSKQLMAMIGGHPYLLKLALAYLKNHQEVTLSEFLRVAPTEAGIYSDHLRQHLLELREDQILASAFKKVVTVTETVQVEPLQAYKLDRMGLVQLSDNQVKPRCELYKKYFSTYLQERD
ncbi:MAG: AAA-like domain-containing protein [Xenococcaceae cyanobacterium MO_167.B52]|nr:AAA-like domain-containing protein [Xenococcaceae cyanobacterium MO_167.B52]